MSKLKVYMKFKLNLPRHLSNQAKKTSLTVMFVRVLRALGLWPSFLALVFIVVKSDGISGKVSLSGPSHLHYSISVFIA